MRRMCFTVLYLVTAVAAVSLSSAAQSTDGSTPQRRVLGYEGSDGLFHPMLRAVPDASTSTTHTGTVQLTIKITVKSSFPSGTKNSFVCNGTLSNTILSATEVPTGVDYDESASSFATGSGTSYSCVVNIPYSWVIPYSATGGQIILTGGYTVSVVNSVTTAGPAVLRTASGDFLSAAYLLTNGATSKYTVNLVL